MDLLGTSKLIAIHSSTSAFTGSTGDASGTTAGSTSGGTGQSTAGGYITASTGVDLSGYSGVLFTATVTNATAATIFAGFSTVGTTAAVTGWTRLGGALAGVATTSPTTTYFTSALDVVNPMQRYLNLNVQIPTSSAIVTSMSALLYGAHTNPAVQPTNLGGKNTVVGTTA